MNYAKYYVNIFMLTVKLRQGGSLQNVRVQSIFSGRGHAFSLNLDFASIPAYRTSIVNLFYLSKFAAVPSSSSAGRSSV